MPGCQQACQRFDRERIFGYYRWTWMLDEEPTVPLSGRPQRRREAPDGLVRFHIAHKLTLLAHSPKHYTETGSLFAGVGKQRGYL